MAKIGNFLPSFKATCITVCVLYIFLVGSLFLKGLMSSMAEFKVPQQTLDSPHYYDAIFWVYTHMIVIGIIIGLLGYFAVENQRSQKIISIVLFIIHAFYTYLDFRSSDSVLGNGLYQGPCSVIPAIIGLIITILFLRLSFTLNSNPVLKDQSSGQV